MKYEETDREIGVFVSLVLPEHVWGLVKYEETDGEVGVFAVFASEIR